MAAGIQRTLEQALVRPNHRFDGQTIAEDPDAPQRLTGLLERVYGVMSDGTWHSLASLASRTGGTEASVSARLRDLRKPRFGRHNVERKLIGHGLWLYRLSDEEVQG